MGKIEQSEQLAFPVFKVPHEGLTSNSPHSDTCKAEMNRRARIRIKTGTTGTKHV